jgi:hypothetical protein
MAPKKRREEGKELITVKRSKRNKKTYRIMASQKSRTVPKKEGRRKGVNNG